MAKLDFKIFFIGFNKCGTRSLHKYFSDCGLDSYHGGVDQELHIRLLLNIAYGEKSLNSIDKYDAYLDVGGIQSNFRDLDRDYPGSKFVLNVRNVNRWLLSRLNHVNGRYVEFMNLYYRTNLTWSDWVDLWRAEFHEHAKAVLEHFRGRDDQFLRFDVEVDRLADLVAFLGIDCSAISNDLPHLGETRDKFYALAGDRIVKL